MTTSGSRLPIWVNSVGRPSFDDCHPYTSARRPVASSGSIVRIQGMRPAYVRISDPVRWANVHISAPRGHSLSRDDIADVVSGRGSRMAVDTSISIDSSRPSTLERPLAASDRWSDVRRAPSVGAAAIAGLIATQMATLVGYYFIGIGLPQHHGRSTTAPSCSSTGLLVLRECPRTSPASRSTWPTASCSRILYRGCSVRTAAGTGHRQGRPHQGDHLRRDPRPDQHGLPGALRVRTEDGARAFQLLRPEHLEAAAGHRLWHLAYGVFLGQLYSPARSPECRRAASSITEGDPG